MDIFTFAMQFEKDGEIYYRELADKESHAGIREICLMLAEAEVKHYHVIEQLSHNVKPKDFETPLLSNAKNVFKAMKVEELDVNITSSLEMYEKALALEKDSLKFYQKQTEDETDSLLKDVFALLANEEAQHAFLLETIIEFVNRPQTWLENAEFNHLDEY